MPALFTAAAAPQPPPKQFWLNWGLGLSVSSVFEQLSLFCQIILFNHLLRTGRSLIYSTVNVSDRDGSLADCFLTERRALRHEAYTSENMVKGITHCTDPVTLSKGSNLIRTG